MLYQLRNPNLRWWERLYLPLVSQQDEYWHVRPANEEQCSIYVHDTKRIGMIMQGGL